MDAISKQDALDIYDDYNIAVENGEIEAYGRFRKQLAQLPPIQPRKGKWIFKSPLWECDQCGCKIHCENPLKGNVWNHYFCKNCGADMRENEVDHDPKIEYS